MKSRVILVLVVLAIVFSIISIVSDIGINQITGGTSREINSLPVSLSFVVIVILILVILLIITDLLRKNY